MGTGGHIESLEIHFGLFGKWKCLLDHLDKKEALFSLESQTTFFSFLPIIPQMTVLFKIC